MSRYHNFCEKLRGFKMDVITSEKELKERNEIGFRCPMGHESVMAVGSFINKTSPKNFIKLRSICNECNTLSFKEDEVTEVTEKLGFVKLRIEKYGDDGTSNGWVVYYRCLCGNESSTDLRNLKKPGRTSHCPKCQNDHNKIDYELLQKNFEDRGCVLLTPPFDYKNNKQKLDFRCACGHISSIIHHDLLRGRLCMSCKTDRSKSTSMIFYGVDNPSKNETIKKKITETMKKHHGVEYAQQSPEIRAKTTATSLERYGKLRAFLLPEVLEKIRKTHKEKYGVEFPFQSKEIQEKIEMAFMEKWNARRPFLSDAYLKMMKEKYGHEWFCSTDTFKQLMLEKYGSEHYVTSDHCRQLMLEKYGSEHYVTSDHCRQLMLEKYGSEHFITCDTFKQIMLKKYGVESAMQCPELFRKAQSSSFSRKPYVSPDGKIFMVLGYEGAALDDILQKEGIKTFYAGEDPEIPVFQYVGDDEKTHYYYPDIYIPEENRVIEVKSIYVYNRDPEKTLCKALQVSEDHLFELRLYNHKKEVVEILECRHGMFYSLTFGLLEIGHPYPMK